MPAIEQPPLLLRHPGKVARRHGARGHRLLVDQRRLRAAFFFRGLITEFTQPGTTFTLKLQSIDGDFAYALWSAETADNVYEMATDTHVVRDGQIVAQSFAGQIRSKR